jgi:methionyl aminopeptidase
MIHLKNKEEIAIMVEGGKKLKKVFDSLKKMVKPGITTYDIDQLAQELISKEGGYPSFKRVKDYYWSVCTPVNEEIVHTPPSKKRLLKEGDLLTIDIGFEYEGLNTDYAQTLIVGKDIYNYRPFLLVGEKALAKAIDAARWGNYIADISLTIESEITKAGYSVVKDLVGHGIGRSLHEDPMVPGFCEEKVRERTPRLEEGLTIAIEVIYSCGNGKITYKKGDNWTIATADNSIAACFETTVAILKKKTLILV